MRLIVIFTALILTGCGSTAPANVPAWVLAPAVYPVLPEGDISREDMAGLLWAYEQSLDEVNARLEAGRGMMK